MPCRKFPYYTVGESLPEKIPGLALVLGLIISIECPIGVLPKYEVMLLARMSIAVLKLLRFWVTLLTCYRFVSCIE